MADSHDMARLAWVQIGLAALAQNFATGLAFGSFGTIVLAIEKEYGAARASSSLAISALVVTLSISAMTLGWLVERVSLRKIMIAGALLSALAFFVASIVTGINALILTYALLLGPATAMLGLVPSMSLATRWANMDRRGLAMGIVNMPAMVMVVPLLMAPVMQHLGLRAAYRIMGLGDLLLIAALLFIQDRPPQAVIPADARRVDAQSPPARTISPLRRPAFWILVVAQGLIVGAGTMKLAHFVPLMIEQGRSFNEANWLLALSGGSGLIGSFLFGILADRIGGVRAMICNALVQAVVWAVFLAPVTLTVLVVDAIIVGACSGGIQGAFGVTIARLFGPENFSKVLGLVSLMTLPFLFGMAPLAGLIYQQTGNYHASMATMIGGLVLAGLVLVPFARHESLAARQAAE